MRPLLLVVLTMAFTLLSFVGRWAIQTSPYRENNTMHEEIRMRPSSDRTHKQGPAPARIIFFHTQKCGGWSVVQFFRATVSLRCPPVQDSPRRCELPEEQKLLMLKTESDAREKALQWLLENDVYFTHVEAPTPGQHIYAARYDSFKFVTILRHPLVRAVSAYNMINSKFPFGNRSVEEWIRNGPEVCASAGHPHQDLCVYHSDNGMTRWFSGSLHTASLKEDFKEGGSAKVHARITLAVFKQASKHLASYDYILLTEDFDRGLPALANLLGHPAGQSTVPFSNVAMHNPNKSTGPTSLQRLNLSISVYSSPRVRYDMKLYQYSVKRYCEEVLHTTASNELSCRSTR
eukprot:gb/GFBE01041504.1/.p1 GENE.gb/GFBE01041504.1/~~gb/GFBE01041504.1/.p1  ORF type:complete len:347 (+),score=-6.67 gb/GFBE01041504.1/:1-1041(+)